MNAPNPPDEHDEIDFFDEVERELVKLTTAQLDEIKLAPQVAAAPAAHQN